jgi:hypothetical protein
MSQTETRNKRKPDKMEKIAKHKNLSGTGTCLKTASPLQIKIEIKIGNQTMAQASKNLDRTLKIQFQ